MSKKATATTVAPKFDLNALMSEHGTKSAVIRYLASQGESRGSIAKLMGIRYQHVRNVLVTPLKKTESTESTSTDQE